MSRHSHDNERMNAIVGKARPGDFGFDIVHVNVDFPRLRLSTVASDHEPLVGLFDLRSK